MPDDTRWDDRLEEIHPNAPVFAVAPVRARSRVPRVAVVGLVVGVLAFVAGIGVASMGPTGRVARPSAAPGASGVATESTGTAPAPATAAAPSTPPGSSAFTAAFEPDRIVGATPGGVDCVAGEPGAKEVPRTRRDGPRLTFQRSWMIWCPIPESRRQAFLVKAFEALRATIPADSFGYSTTSDGAGDALYPYAQYPLAGTVAITANAAGDGLAIAVVLEEWRPDEVQ